MAKILIVDDSKVIRDLLIEFLGELGHLVDSADDGAEGLEKASNGDYDLCICDVHFPKLNGYELLMKLGKAETVCIFDNHDGCIGHVYADLDDNR